MPSSADIRAYLRRFEDPAAWPPVRRDWIVVAAWLVLDALDIALENEQGLSFTSPDPTPALTWVFLVPFALLLLLRRRASLAALAGGYLLMCTAAAADAHLEKGFMPVAQMAFLAFCAARRVPGRRELAVVIGVSLVGVAGATLTFTGAQGVGDFIWASVMVLALPVAAARAYRHHEELAALLAERATQLEVQRDERARLAVAQERERIAGELHDVVAHGVSAMVVQASAARRLVAAQGDTPAAHTAIAEVESSGRAALDELRRLLGVLRRGDEALALAPQPSLRRVDRLVARLRDEGLPVDLSVEGEPVALPPGLDVTAYRIVEEALTDVLRDAGAGPVRVRVRYGGRELQVAVTDETGTRPDAVTDPASAFGLRERVALFGGELHAGRRRGGGWELEARMPIERAAA
jgi:signal transduction histidine kinase